MRGSSMTCVSVVSISVSTHETSTKLEEEEEGAEQTHLSQFTNLVTQSTDTSEGSPVWIFHAHVINQGIDFTRECPAGKGEGQKKISEARKRTARRGSPNTSLPHDGESRHIQRYPRSSLELVLWYAGSATYNVPRSRGGFDDD